MNKHKRLLSLLLAVVMVLGMFPMAASADDQQIVMEGHIDTCLEDCTGVACECACHQPAVVNDDPVDLCPNCDVETCTGCDGIDLQNDDEDEDTDPVCTGDPATCTIADCECKQDNDKPLCDKCNATETAEGAVKHETTCPEVQYVPECTGKIGCPVENCPNDHCTGVPATCPITDCECKQETEEPKKDEEPKQDEESKQDEQPLCDKCEATKDEKGEIVHAEDCETLCNCTPAGDVHMPYCNLYVAPEEELPEVGDKIWIKSDSVIYKSTEDTEGHITLLPYYIKIEAIEIIDGTLWYQFKFTGISAGVGNSLLKDYKWVKAENTVETACTCDAKDGKHSAECPLYVVDETEKIVQIAGGISAVATGIPADGEIVFNEIHKDNLDMIEEYIDFMVSGAATFGARSSSEVWTSAKKLFAYDIKVLNPDGTEWQPGDEPVEIKLTLPELNLGEDEVVRILHVHGDDVEILNAEVLEDGKTISFVTDGFSFFYGVSAIVPSGNVPIYNLVEATSVNVQTIVNALKDEFTTVNGIGTIDNVTSSDTSLVTVSKNNETNVWTASIKERLKEREVYLTVDNVKIYLTDRGYRYAIPGTDWMMGTNVETRKVTPNATGKEVTLKVIAGENSVLTEPNMENHRTTDLDSTTTHLDIYLRAGHALEVATGTYFSHGTWSAASYNDGDYHKDHWTWVYTHVDDDVAGKTTNYIVADNVKEPVVADIQFRDTSVDDDKTWIINAKLYIIPENTVTPTLVRETLSGNKFEVRELPTTLYNYDGAAFNEYMDSKNTGNYFGFQNYSKGVKATESVTLPWSGTNLPNSGSVSTGMMKKELDNGVPVANSTANTDFFSTQEFSGKDVTENVGFEFIYNTETGYYTYSSNLNHAQYNEQSKKIELYDQTLAPYFGLEAFTQGYIEGTTEPAQNTRAGFYPFADIHKAFMNTDRGLTSWQSAVGTDFFQQNAIFAKDPVKTSSYLNPSTVDMHFGIQLDVDFYMPKGKMVDVNKDGTNEDLIYAFTGDDDLWVYVDNKLVLDIGGAHTAVSGTINFTEQTVTLGSYAEVTANGNTWTLGETGSNKTWTFAELGITETAETKMHNMKVFYLERWSGESNCRMHFNLPLIPSNSVTVSKDLVNHEGNDFSVTPDVEYTFKIETSYNDGQGSAYEQRPYVGSYTVGSETRKTNENGEFTLKNREVAIFNDISQFTTVYVAEKGPDDNYVYTKVAVSVNGEEVHDHVDDIEDWDGYDGSENATMGPDGSLSFAFTNYMQTEPMVIKKIVNDETDTLDLDEVEFTFAMDITEELILEKGVGEIKGTKGGEEIDLTDGGTFNLKHNESIIIPRVPVNMPFTLSETAPTPAYGYEYVAPEFTAYENCAFDTAYEYVMGTNSEVTVTNTYVAVLADLKITKEIFEEDTIAADQSFVFKVEKVLDDNSFEYIGTVVIPAAKLVDGTESILIKDLQIGKYKVTELTDWSWRYDVVDEKGNPESDNQTMTIARSENTTEYKFFNRRTNNYWLDGESHAKNVFAGVSND